MDVIFESLCNSYLRYLKDTLSCKSPEATLEKVNDVIEKLIFIHTEFIKNPEDLDECKKYYYLEMVVDGNFNFSIKYSLLLFLESKSLLKQSPDVAMKTLLESIFHIGSAYGYFFKKNFEPNVNTSEHLSKAGSSTEKSQNSQKIKLEVISYLEENISKKKWKSFDDSLSDLIKMLIDKSDKGANFKINKNTIRNNLKVWNRKSDDTPKSNLLFQEKISAIFNHNHP